MRLDRQYLVWGLVYLVLGVVLGTMMAASENYSQRVTHAHLLLVGFVVSMMYGITHRLWLAGRRRRLGLVQFITHQAGAVSMIVGLYCLFGAVIEPAMVEPILKVSSLAVIAAAVMMLVMVFIDGE
jgi:hypothetical protein